MENLHNHGHLSIPEKEIPSDTKLIDSSEIFSLLSDPTRLKILLILCHSEQCVYNLAAYIKMSAPVVSHHLRFLKQAGIIKNRREGKEVHYSLCDTKKAKLVHHIIDQLIEL